jgi:hypothetical protein
LSAVALGGVAFAPKAADCGLEKDPIFSPKADRSPRLSQ